MSRAGHFDDVGSDGDDMVVVVYVVGGVAWAWAEGAAANPWPSAMTSLAAGAMSAPEWATGGGGRGSAGARPGTEGRRPPRDSRESGLQPMETWAPFDDLFWDEF